MQKPRQPSCRLTGFLFYQFLNYILLFLRDPVRRVSSQPNGVVRYVPFFSRHTHVDHHETVGRHPDFDLPSPLPVIGM